MRDPVLGEIGFLILIISLGLFIIFSDKHDDDDNNKGGRPA